MTRRPRTLLLLCGLLPTIAATVFCLYRPRSFTNLDYAVYDALTRATPTRPPDSRIVIVDVDERSLAAVGQWPWRRDVIGLLVSRLRALGARTVALDMIFAEADRFQPGTPDSDDAFANALRGGRVAIGYALTFDDAAAKATSCIEHPIGLAIVRRGDETTEPFFKATGSICNLPQLTAAASASGFLNAAPDPDGRLRRVPLLIELQNQIYPSLALAAVTADRQPVSGMLTVANVNATSLSLDTLHAPLDGKANLLLRYRGGKRTFPYISAADVLSGVTPSTAVDGKIVFIGTTALGTREVVATPLDTLFSGVEVQATVADNLLRQDFFHRPVMGATLEAQMIVALGIAATLLVIRLGLGWAIAAIAVSVAGVWLACGWLLASRGLFISPLFPTLGLGGSLVAMIVARFTIEHGRADEAVSATATSQRLMVQSLLSLTEVRDADTGKHSRRTQGYTRILATELAHDPNYASYLTPDTIELLASLAPLHDIGKVGVPDSLLNKPGSLTSEEIVEMRKHPAHGRDVIVHAEHEVGVNDDRILSMAKDIVYTHHERWDGTGYPRGLQGPTIPIPGRLIAIVDVYDALRARRRYRQPMSHDDAVAVIVNGKGTHFDPAVVDAFLAVSATLKKLSTEAADGD